MAKEVVTKMKEKKFCGLTLEQLKELSMKDLSLYLPARSRRSILRHPEIVEKFVKSAEEKISRKKKVRTHLRDVIIVPRMIGMPIQVYSGKTFEEIMVTIEMIGHRLGEFVMTRNKVNHSAPGIGATRGSKAAKK